jgi:hypothetical protein
MLEENDMSALELISEVEIMSAIRYLDPDAAIVSAIRYLDADFDPERATEDAVRMVFEICIGLLTMLMATGTFILLYFWKN